MTKDELMNQVEPIIREVFNKPDLAIAEDMGPNNQEAWTSLSFLQLLTAIENRFGFRFKIMEIPMLDNLGQVLDATLRHIY